MIACVWPAETIAALFASKMIKLVCVVLTTLISTTPSLAQSADAPVFPRDDFGKIVLSHEQSGQSRFEAEVGLHKSEPINSYGEDAAFVQECHGCHTPVKDNDFVFTHPASMP